MKYKVICLDIDGTLLDNRKVLHPKVRESIGRAVDSGARIVLNSARMPAGVEPIEQELGVPCIKICNGGAFILDGGKCISEKHFSAGTMEEIYEQCMKPRRLHLWIYWNYDWYVTGMDVRAEREIKVIGCRPQTVDIEKLAACWKQENTGPSKLLISAEPAVITEIQEEMETKLRQGAWEDISMAKSAPFFLEIFPRGIDKGTVLETVCQSLGIPPAEAAAFGDQEMDIPMIRTAGLGVAMENAVDELKAVADYITFSNEEDGVAAALDKMMAGEL